MLISVIIPVFNRPDLLRGALESVFAQTWPDLEVVVVDDGSTEPAEGVVREFAARRTRAIRCVRQNNAGCAAARNTGFRASRGDAVSFLDSDDAWEPEALASLAATLL